jgi:hypothetical protein
MADQGPRPRGAAPRLSTTAVLALAVLVAGCALRRRPRWAVAAAMLVALVLLANAVVASSLTFAYTIDRSAMLRGRMSGVHDER